MDPYLEHPTLWQDVHDRLIAAIADAMVPAVAPDYYVALQRYAYLLSPGQTVYIGRPDVAIGRSTLPTAGRIQPMPIWPGVLEVDRPMKEELDENYLEVREVKTGRLITVIEILLSKQPGEFRQEYLEKRQNILRTRTNFVEIDLLRNGQPMPTLGPEVQSDYRILITPYWRRPRAQLYTFNLRQPIPDFPLPLLPHDEQPLVHLNQILHDLYTRARFDLRLDYTVPPVPSLAPDDAAWAAQLLTV